MEVGKEVLEPGFRERILGFSHIFALPFLWATLNDVPQHHLVQGIKPMPQGERVQGQGTYLPCISQSGFIPTFHMVPHESPVMILKYIVRRKA